MDRRSELDTVEGRQEQSQERGREHMQKPAVWLPANQSVDI